MPRSLFTDDRRRGDPRAFAASTLLVCERSGRPPVSPKPLRNWRALLGTDSRSAARSRDSARSLARGRFGSRASEPPTCAHHSCASAQGRAQPVITCSSRTPRTGPFLEQGRHTIGDEPRARLVPCEQELYERGLELVHAELVAGLPGFQYSACRVCSGRSAPLRASVVPRGPVASRHPGQRGGRGPPGAPRAASVGAADRAGAKSPLRLYVSGGGSSRGRRRGRRRQGGGGPQPLSISLVVGEDTSLLASLFRRKIVLKQARSLSWVSADSATW